MHTNLPVYPSTHPMFLEVRRRLFTIGCGCAPEACSNFRTLRMFSGMWPRYPGICKVT